MRGEIGLRWAVSGDEVGERVAKPRAANIRAINHQIAERDGRRLPRVAPRKLRASREVLLIEAQERRLAALEVPNNQISGEILCRRDEDDCMQAGPSASERAATHHIA